MNERVSHAEFEEFPLKEKKHYSEAKAGKTSLGPGLHVSEDSREVPHHLTRSRIAHDTTDSYPDSFTSLHDTYHAPSNTAFQTSYQAMTAGNAYGTPKRAGKKTFQPVAGPSQPSLSSFMGGGTLAKLKEENLQLGTTKMSPHVPGYTGHIPSSTAPGASVSSPAPLRDPNAKNLIIENYKPMLGYTGRLGR
ncbi:hypothetical protein CEUSTIGMA_g11118.t1 [Chlamydomonas eustigma]|uniref:Uncharacterized protein n=1 Tax=Chlamydomonas eustigma TaxID=1157962 RepID=A0A250XKZ1_9CHLO|nr:hypothetical protein CEUSTIGMA_g11118.t1 [Chlamydomonas eustigma]|eukprot:GAX83693.1 hypothetical protein CEUSTIGMA_g11118.t1 [Chlamydomonas eustigma]